MLRKTTSSETRFWITLRQTLDDTEEDERLRLGEGRQVFSRENKRLCGLRSCERCAPARGR